MSCKKLKKDTITMENKKTEPAPTSNRLFSDPASPFLFQATSCICLTEASLPPLRQEDAVILCLTAGSAQIRQDNSQSLTVQANTATVLPTKKHRITLSGQEWQGILLSVSGATSSAFAEELSKEGSLPVENTPVLLAIRDIERSFNAGLPASELLLSEQIYHLFCLLLTASRYNRKPGISSSNIVRRCIEYLELTVAEPFDLAALSETVGVSKYHLSRLFSSRIGMSLRDYHAFCRIRESKRLLADPSLSSAAVCERLGFVDMSHFVKTFKKQENMTPSQYRKRILPQ